MEHHAIQFLCRAHPEGAFPGTENPLRKVINLENRKFEEILPYVDVVILDTAVSTIFLRTLVTNKPIIYLQLGKPYFNKEFTKLIEKRCMVIDAQVDENGKMGFDEDVFVSNILCPRLPEDEALHEIRNLVLGGSYDG